ncbi:mechanosensitive ion channel family protein [Bacillus atrophaeus]|uniref:mechanosensitive ion channel family protein n=1 Tax=Bacillus atrophaeus TaxID=1452 RepID=UPI00227E781F|nr:mechanosensitive ion channel family protein [Bacillus atrophaeus]MCY7946908.1 mechanosensitive ion channel family protein [Bacillus atrophaeus]MCY8094877.1 mechanosensitive ion channel family protein [Bacillus atrophaeus]MCY9170846.1 mechanosensitive ion channel family protein [Bacillus atrophaeus]MEC0743666.1 mechanosensitive ion channel family protein [Bacillus atrophaeus]MEC0747327.1 mechanosensitive ion channel family protein [Bacillus atrophaeus]
MRMKETFIDILKSKTFDILIVAALLWVGVFIINRFVQAFFKRTDFIEERKEKTIESLVRSLTRYSATIGFILYVVSMFVDDFGKILAGAGVAGIVIGFGAQSLIKDIVAGIFLIYERQLHKGDYVTVNNLFNGTVEEIGLRSLQIREWSGKLLTISNGEVRQIENYNINYMRITESLLVSFKEDPERVYRVLEEACDMLNQELRDSLKRDEFLNPEEPFQVHGITSLNKINRGIEFTVKGMVKDQDYFSASLTVRRVLVRQLYQHNVQMLEEAIRVDKSQ